MPSSTSWKLQSKDCIIKTMALHTRIIVPALIIYSLPRLSISDTALLKEGALYSGSSMMKKDLRVLCPAILLTRSAPIRIMKIPTKYIRVPTQPASSKKAPAKSAITGSFAPQGIQGESIAVAFLSRSLRIVRHAITPGIAHPVPTTKGITDLPDRPTLLKIGSRTTVARAMYPQSSRREMRKYITITRGRKPTTADTPPIIPSVRSDARKGFASTRRPATHSLNMSIRVTRPGIAKPFSNSIPSAIQAPSQDWEIWNTRNIITAKIGIPSHLSVRISSSLSCLPKSLVKDFLTSTSDTILFTKANLVLSASRTAALSLVSTPISL